MLSSTPGRRRSRHSECREWERGTAGRPDDCNHERATPAGLSPMLCVVSTELGADGDRTM